MAFVPVDVVSKGVKKGEKIAKTLPKQRAQAPIYSKVRAKTSKSRAPIAVMEDTSEESPVYENYDFQVHK